VGTTRLQSGRLHEHRYATIEFATANAKHVGVQQDRALPTARPEPATQPPTTPKVTDPTNGGPESSRQPCATYSPSPPSRPWLCSSPHRPTPIPTRTCRTRSPGCSAVAGCLLNELNAQGQAEFGCRRDFVDRSIQNYCPDKAPISHENSAFRLHHHHGWYGHRRSHHTGTAAANAEPRCMNYMWYRACHDPATDKWQLCNLYNDG
jgi:hypothetical protein